MHNIAKQSNLILCGLQRAIDRIFSASFFRNTSQIESSGFASQSSAPQDRGGEYQGDKWHLTFGEELYIILWIGDVALKIGGR